MRRRHHKPLMLTDDERRTLEQWARRPKTAQRVALRSRIVLACAEGVTNRTVATRLGVSSNSVCTWRERFRVRRLEGLADEPRPGVTRKVTDDVLADIITRTLEAPPPNTTQWTTRSMAEVAGLSKATISRIWRTFGLQSHRVDTFKLSADPQCPRWSAGLFAIPVTTCISRRPARAGSIKSNASRSAAPGWPGARSEDIGHAERRATPPGGMRRPRTMSRITVPGH